MAAAPTVLQLPSFANDGPLRRPVVPPHGVVSLYGFGTRVSVSHLTCQRFPTSAGRGAPGVLALR